MSSNWELSSRSDGRVSALPLLDTAPSLGDLFPRTRLQTGGDVFLVNQRGKVMNESMVRVIAVLSGTILVVL